MFYSKEMQNALKNSKGCCGGTLVLGMLSGAAITGAVFMATKLKKGNHSVKRLFCGCCERDQDDLNEDGYDEPCDAERSRNGFDCHGEERDSELLHSCGCLGYPHDDCGGFADSKGDRPSDLTNPELQRQGADGAESTLQIKNSRKKSNPQPENKINEVKEK